MDSITPAVANAIGTPKQALPNDRLGVDVPALKQAILEHLEYTLASASASLCRLQPSGRRGALPVHPVSAPWRPGSGGSD